MRILVTGASTGIGAATARRLAGASHTVFAGVRKPADAAAVRSFGATAVFLDVTDEDQVTATAEQVGDLDGLVLNAGISHNGPLELLPVDTLRRMLDVNTVGAWAVTHACLPGLRRTRGRIVFVSSMAGRLVVPLSGPYSASKYAIEALADALRRELRPWGMKVVLIEPGSVRTAIFDKHYTFADDMLPRLPEGGLELYQDRIERLVDIVRQSEPGAIPPDVVAQRIEHALTARRPPLRIPVGWDAWALVTLSTVLPAWVLDRLFDVVLPTDGRG